MHKKSDPSSGSNFHGVFGFAERSEPSSLIIIIPVKKKTQQGRLVGQSLYLGCAPDCNAGHALGDTGVDPDYPYRGGGWWVGEWVGWVPGGRGLAKPENRIP